MDTSNRKVIGPESYKTGGKDNTRTGCWRKSERVSTRVGSRTVTVIETQEALKLKFIGCECVGRGEKGRVKVITNMKLLERRL